MLSMNAAEGGDYAWEWRLRHIHLCGVSVAAHRMRVFRSWLRRHAKRPSACSHHHQRAAANAVHGGFHHGDGEAGGDGSIHRVAASFQNLRANPCRIWMGCDRNTMPGSDPYGSIRLGERSR